jgi:hypothetical protein
MNSILNSKNMCDKKMEKSGLLAPTAKIPKEPKYPKEMEAEA